MTAPLTLTAYAKLRGVSVKSVSRAIATGRLVQSVGRDHLGRPTITDPDLAGREWDTNTRQRADGHPIAARDPTSAGEPASSARAAAPAPLQSEGPAARAPLADVPDLNISRQIREAALARRDTAHADMAELELAERRGELVNAKEADAGYEEHIARAKTRLLGVPAQLGQRLPDLAQRVVPIAKELIREALAELALDGRA